MKIFIDINHPAHVHYFKNLVNALENKGHFVNITARDKDVATDFYIRNFITSEGIPKFYHNKTHPIDCTSASQTILTLVRFGHLELASKVAFWTINNMQTPKGSFYYRKYKYYTSKTSFMRWSNAWMFLALSFLKYKIETQK